MSARDAGGPTGAVNGEDTGRFSTLGPRVGRRIPDFTLTDQNGETWTNETIIGPKGAVLVFFRSADW